MSPPSSPVPADVSTSTLGRRAFLRPLSRADLIPWAPCTRGDGRGCLCWGSQQAFSPLSSCRGHLGWAVQTQAFRNCWQESQSYLYINADLPASLPLYLFRMRAPAHLGVGCVCVCPCTMPFFLLGTDQPGAGQGAVSRGSPHPGASHPHSVSLNISTVFTVSPVL